MFSCFWWLVVLFHQSQWFLTSAVLLAMIQESSVRNCWIDLLRPKTITAPDRTTEIHSNPSMYHPLFKDERFTKESWLNSLNSVNCKKMNHDCQSVATLVIFTVLSSSFSFRTRLTHQLASTDNYHPYCLRLRKVFTIRCTVIQPVKPNW